MLFAGTGVHRRGHERHHEKPKSREESTGWDKRSPSCVF